MPDISEDRDSLSSIIGELRADNRRHTESSAGVVAELRRLTEKIDGVAQLAIELREYRKTLHDRFDRINEIAAQHTLDIDKLQDRFTDLESTKFNAFDRRLSTMETTWRVQLRTVAIVGSVVLSIGGWVLGTYGPMLMKTLFGG